MPISYQVARARQAELLAQAEQARERRAAARRSLQRRSRDAR